MISFSYKNIKVCFHFSFFAAVTLLMLFSGNPVSVYSFYACMLHETGHLVIMLIMGQRVKRLVFYGAGIKIIPYRSCEAETFTAETAVLGAGCAVNFLVCVFSVLLNGKMSVFGAVNLVIGLFNIMPMSFLDGGKILVQCFYRFWTFENAVKLEKLLKEINMITVPAAAVIMYIAGVRNFTIYVTLIFLMFSSAMM